MSRWFRFYNEALDDPKVQQLDPVVFKHWVNLLCIACRNDGKLPSHEAMAFSLRLDIIGLESLLDRLLIAGLIDVRKGGANGSYIAPHGWEKRQYKSDTSTERVKRFRNVSVTVNETAPETDTETELLAAKATSKARAPAIVKPAGVSDQVWHDFEKHRRAKKAPITETALAAFRREADKVGWTLEEAITESVARDWRGFKAEWVKENGRSNTNRQTAPDGRTMGKTEAAVRAIAARVAGPGERGGNNHGPVALPDNRRAIGYVER